MNELEDRLGKILWNMGVPHLLPEDLQKFEQAFKEAGWTPHLSAYHEAFLDGVKKEAGLMTGQEWYERFDQIWGDMYREKKNPLTAEEFISAAKQAADQPK